MLILKDFKSIRIRSYSLEVPQGCKLLKIGTAPRYGLSPAGPFRCSGESGSCHGAARDAYGGSKPAVHGSATAEWMSIELRYLVLNRWRGRCGRVFE